MRNTFSKVACAAIAAVIAFSLIALSGCGSKAPESITIGSADNAEYTIDVTNGTGQLITGVACRGAGAADFEKLAVPGDKWNLDQVAKLCIPNLASADASDGAENAVQLRDQIDLQITVMGGSTFELHGIAPEGITKATLKTDPDSKLAYLEYTVNGKTESTLESEKAYLVQAQSATQEDAILVEENADDASVATEVVIAPEPEPDETPSASKYSYSDEGSQGSDSASVDQSEDQCVEGGVQFR